ncbi:MAG: hypothetical protein CMF61_02565 [Magnetococcales bacterium]|nr:hypothetical protein [Magnetococcales bacterium]
MYTKNVYTLKCIKTTFPFPTSFLEIFMSLSKLNPQKDVITAQVVQTQRNAIAEEKAREEALTKIEKLLKEFDLFINEAMYRLIEFPQDSLSIETSYQLGYSRDRQVETEAEIFFKENIENFDAFEEAMATKYGLKNTCVSFEKKSGHEIDDMCQSGDGYYYRPTINFTAELDL